MSLFRFSSLVLFGPVPFGIMPAVTIANQGFSIYAPSGTLSPLPYIEMTSSGSFSLDYTAIENIPVGGSRTVPLSSVLSFNLSGTVTGNDPGVNVGSSSFIFGLADVTAMTVTAINRQLDSAGLVGHLEIYDFTLTTRPVASSNPNYGNVSFVVNYAYSIVGAGFSNQNVFGLNPSPTTARVDGFLNLITVPEPATFGAISFAGLGLLWFVKRRHSRSAGA